MPQKLKPIIIMQIGKSIDFIKNKKQLYNFRFNVYRIVYLRYKDRILFETTHLYVFVESRDEAELPSDLSMVITWE